MPSHDNDMKPAHILGLGPDWCKNELPEWAGEPDAATVRRYLKVRADALLNMSEPGTRDFLRVLGEFEEFAIRLGRLAQHEIEEGGR